MTPELLGQYLKVLKESDLTVFRVVIGSDTFEGSFSPPPIPEFKGEALEPGGWKGPSHLDQISEVID